MFYGNKRYVEVYKKNLQSNFEDLFMNYYWNHLIEPPKQ